MEECGELARACSKVIRHGTSNPKYLQNLVSEMGDVIAMCEVLQRTYKIKETQLEDAIHKRHEKMNQIGYE
jgi:NTP pyrophosphatase (non-canonical NTP hydrolase)